MRRLLAAVLALALGSSVAYADTKAATNFVDKVAGQALAIVQTDEAQPNKQAKLETLFRSNADIPFVAKFVLGRHWRTATPAQQKDYVAAYEPFLMKHYVGRIIKYSGQSYKITGSKESPEGTLVTMEITDPGKPSVFVDYRVRDEGKGRFKVIDIIVEGVSLLNTQRSEFNAVVTNKGIDHLIDALKKKTAPNPAA